MPKRSAQERIDRYQKKIRKLEEKQRNHRKRSSSSSNDGNDDSVAERSGEDNDPSTADTIPQSESSVHEEPNPPQDSTPTESVEPALDPDLLSALGDASDDTPEFGDKIHENLAKIWPPLLKKGLQKEDKQKILKEYLIPSNCTLLQAPKLNPEISAAVPEMVRNRDKNLMTQQQQLGSGISAINRAMDLLIKGEDKVQAIKHLSNGCRILSDLHAASTKSRMKLVTPSLDKTFLHIIQDAERDDTLFGNELSGKIKASKAIERQGRQIKKVSTQKSSNITHPTATRQSYSGNWQAPPRHPASRGGRGGYKRPPPPPPPNSRRPYASAQAVRSKPRAQT